MIIEYKDNYRITVNSYSWDMEYRTTYKEGGSRSVRNGNTTTWEAGDKTGWMDGGFFTNLSSLVEKIIRIEVSQREETLSLKDFISEYQKTREEIITKVEG